MASGAYLPTAVIRLLTIEALMLKRSSRVMPGCESGGVYRLHGKSSTDVAGRVYRGSQRACRTCVRP